MKTIRTTADQKTNRRQFLGSTATAAIGLTILKPQLAFGTEANGKINLGLIGCGGRGQWIANLFAQNGHYNLVAAADYFQDRVDAAGEKFGIPPERRFSGLSGYRRLLEQKLDAVAIETPPFFHPEQAAAAVEAGKHVYLAKPIAVDVPGCHTVEASGKKATEKKLCFQVDFQTRAHPAYQEAAKRVHDGQIGRIVSVDASYHCGSTFGGMDAALRKDPLNPEARLRAWGLDRVLSGDVITEQNIHALDVASWFLDAEPIKAYGTGGQSRGFLGTCWDHFAVVFYFPNGVIVSFNSKQVGFGFDDIQCRVFGTQGTADTHYGGDVWVRSKDDLFNGGKTGNIFTEGVQRNIATFHDNIAKGDHANPSVAPSVRSNLTTILGRTAAYKNSEVTWAEIMRANEKFNLDLKGLKA
jgi:myo-inositol 2-dehydrogenase/D-chiro-inositol 1-dehydrogenase